jgi:hypothetical protein
MLVEFFCSSFFFSLISLKSMVVKPKFKVILLFIYFFDCGPFFLLIFICFGFFLLVLIYLIFISNMVFIFFIAVFFCHFLNLFLFSILSLKILFHLFFYQILVLIILIVFLSCTSFLKNFPSIFYLIYFFIQI